MKDSVKLGLCLCGIESVGIAKDGEPNPVNIGGMESLTPWAGKSAEPAASVAEESVRLAERMLARSLFLATRAEEGHMKRMAELIADAPLKSVVLRMTDLFWRSLDAGRTARCWRQVLRQFGRSEGASRWDRGLLKLGGLGSRLAPGAVVPLVRRRLRQESADVILPADEPAFGEYLSRRNATGVRLNINQLGEAVLGEEEAERRMARALALLERPEVDYVSVKISAFFSQINVIA